MSRKPGSGKLRRVAPHTFEIEKPSMPIVTEEMIQAACVAGYGVDTDKDSNLYKLMQRALQAGLAARGR